MVASVSKVKHFLLGMRELWYTPRRRYSWQRFESLSKISLTSYFVHFCKTQMDFAGGTSGKEPSCQGKRCKRCGFGPWVRESPGVGNSNPFQYSCWENSIWTEDPDRLQSMGLQRVGQNWVHIHIRLNLLIWKMGTKWLSQEFLWDLNKKVY